MASISKVTLTLCNDFLRSQNIFSVREEYNEDKTSIHRTDLAEVCTLDLEVGQFFPIDSQNFGRIDSGNAWDAWESFRCVQHMEPFKHAARTRIGRSGNTELCTHAPNTPAPRMYYA